MKNMVTAPKITEMLDPVHAWVIVAEANPPTPAYTVVAAAERSLTVHKVADVVDPRMVTEVVVAQRWYPVFLLLKQFWLLLFQVVPKL